VTKITSNITTRWCGIPHAITMPKHVFYDLSYSTIMGEWLENAISDLKNEYSWIWTVIQKTL